MGRIGKRDKVRLRSGSHVSRSIIVRPNRTEKIQAKTAVPIAALFSTIDIKVVHADLVGREYGTSLRLQDRTTKQWHVFILEKSPLLDAAGRRLSHYVDAAFGFVFGIGILIVLLLLFGYFMDYVGIPVIRGLGNVAGSVGSSVADSRLLGALLAVALVAVVVTTVGFFLALGWRIAGRVFKSK